MIAYRLLVVHGYRAYRKGTAVILTAQNLAVCQKVAQIAPDFDFVLLLGGWHDRSLTAEQTIAVVMRDELVRLGVPYAKVILPNNHPALAYYLPPRDTAEEGKVLSLFLAASRRARREYDVTALAVKEWIPRIKRIYAVFGISSANMIAVKAPTPFYLRWVEWGLRIISCVDPLGTGDVTGALQRYIRHSHTLTKDPRLEPLINR